MRTVFMQAMFKNNRRKFYASNHLVSRLTIALQVAHGPISIAGGLLVSSHELEALLVPKLNRASTANCSSIGLHRISFVRAAEETFRTIVFDALR